MGFGLSMNKIWSLYGNLMREAEIVLGDATLNDKGLSFEEISNKLKDKGITFKDNDLFFVLQILLSRCQRIVKDDFWYKDSEYMYLDKEVWGSKFQQGYYSFTDDMLSTKVFLLISDTHIGNNELFNAKLLNNIYDYAIKSGASICFHTGDLFQRLSQLLGDIYKNSNIQNILSDCKKDFINRISLFENFYPKPDPKEFRTYCLPGNHDKTLDSFLRLQPHLNSCDLRMLSIYNPSFYMFPTSDWCTTLNEIKFHFNHKLYMSSLIRDLKIEELEDISKSEEKFGNLILDYRHDILVSGHMHSGLLYTNSALFNQKDNLYLGVPSTSNINIGHAVGYLVYMYPESNSMEVSILGTDGNLNIFELDRISWNFGKKNKCYRRTY